MGDGSVNNVSFDALEAFSRNLDTYKGEVETALRTLQDVASIQLKVGKGDIQGMISKGYGNLLSDDAVKGYSETISQLEAVKKGIDDTIAAWRAGEDTARGRFAG